MAEGIRSWGPARMPGGAGRSPRPGPGCPGQAWRSGCPGYPMINDKDPIRPLVYDQRRHPGRRRSEPGDLPLILDRVSAAAPGRGDAQLPVINIAEKRGLAAVSGFLEHVVRAQEQPLAALDSSS